MATALPPSSTRFPTSEAQIVGVALALGARSIDGWSPAEELLASSAPRPSADLVEQIREGLIRGEDPLGLAFCMLRSPADRRPMGATYTPNLIVSAMSEWARAAGNPALVVDPGTGSGRFLIAAGTEFSEASLVGVELDPLAALMTRAALAVCGFASRSSVVLSDYRSVKLPSRDGKTLFIGNPPYVRHHEITPDWKTWLARTAARRGLTSSKLAGLHVHFFLATLNHANKGDFGCFITAAEWLDVNYGKLVREAFLRDLGGTGIHIIEPDAQPFPDASSTAAVTCFEVGSRARSVVIRRVSKLEDLAPLSAGASIRRERLEAAPRWTPLSRAGRVGPGGWVELGELCRVHRGAVTGANKVWIAGTHSVGLPDSVLYPSVTKARELIQAGRVLADPYSLRKVIDLPTQLDLFDAPERKVIEQFLTKARSLGADQSYIARMRRAWWSVGLREPAPILATYMARRPPAFVRNRAAARHINIAHGIYPRETLSELALKRLVEHLSTSVSTNEGRTYAGGLTKFEPREMERLLVPPPDQLNLPEEAAA